MPKIKLQNSKEVLIYQAKSGAIELKADLNKETIWANINQISELFGVQKAAISKHIKNIFDTGELSQRATVSILETVQKEGSRSISRNIQVYNLDMIIAVGYRINSKNATNFRIWATKTLHEYLLKGYVINRKQIVKNYQHFLSVVEDIKKLLPANTAIESGDVVELVALFADTWLSLDAYDKGDLSKGKLTKKSVPLTTKKIHDNISVLKKELMQKSEATDMFGMEKSIGLVDGIVGNIMQSFGGHDVYQSAEEKAAHLFYFMVKNHPFTDGNKRSGAFAFVWYLKQAKILDTKKLTPAALTALTILVASSEPSEKEKVVSLILNLIAK